MFRGLTGLRRAIGLINSGYCVADPAGIVTDDGNGTISTLTGLSRLPECPASTSSDTIAGWIR